MLQAFFLLAGATGVFAVPVSNTADGGPPDFDNGCPMDVDHGSQGCHTENSNVTIQRSSNSPRPRYALDDCKCDDDGEYWCHDIINVPVLPGLICPPGASGPIPSPDPDPPVTTESITVPPTTITVYPPTTSPFTSSSSDLDPTETSSQPQPSKSSSTKTSTSDGPTPSPPSSSSAVPPTSTRTTGAPTSSSQLTSSTPSSIHETTTSTPTPTSTGSPHPPGKQPCTAAPTLLKELTKLWVALEEALTPEFREQWKVHDTPYKTSLYLAELEKHLKGIVDDEFNKPSGIESWYAEELRANPERRARTLEYVRQSRVASQSRHYYMNEKGMYKDLLLSNPALYNKTANDVRDHVCMYRAAFKGDELPPGPSREEWAKIREWLEDLLRFLLSLKAV